MRTLKALHRSVNKPRTQAINQFKSLLVTAPAEQRIQFFDERRKKVNARLRRTTVVVAPKLVELHGVGPDTASILLITVGDNPEWLANERAFAALTGCSPIPASSGKTHRPRLNCSGDRRANAALWRIAIVRLASGERSRTYIATRVSEGNSKIEAIRCLKRCIAREVFAALPQTAAS